MAQCPGSLEEIVVQRKASAALAALQAASTPSFDAAIGAYGLPSTLRGLPRALSLPGLEPYHSAKVFRGGATGLVRRQLPREAHLAGTPCRLPMDPSVCAASWSPALSKAQPLPLPSPEIATSYARTAPHAQRVAAPLGAHLLGMQTLGGNPLDPSSLRQQSSVLSLSMAATPPHAPAAESLGSAPSKEIEAIALELRESVIDLSDRIAEIERVTRMLHPSYTASLQDKLKSSFRDISRRLGDLDEVRHRRRLPLAVWRPSPPFFSEEEARTRSARHHRLARRSHTKSITSPVLAAAAPRLALLRLSSLLPIPPTPSP